jgi:hypothetical protein
MLTSATKQMFHLPTGGDPFLGGKYYHHKRSEVTENSSHWGNCFEKKTTNNGFVQFILLQTQRNFE